MREHLSPFCSDVILAVAAFLCSSASEVCVLAPLFPTLRSQFLTYSFLCQIDLDRAVTEATTESWDLQFETFISVVLLENYFPSVHNFIVL